MTVTGAGRSLLIWGPLPVDLDSKDDDTDAAADFRFVFVFMDFFVIGLFWILMVFNRFRYSKCFFHTPDMFINGPKPILYGPP